MCLKVTGMMVLRTGGTESVTSSESWKAEKRLYKKYARILVVTGRKFRLHGASLRTPGFVDEIYRRLIPF